MLQTVTELFYGNDRQNTCEESSGSKKYLEEEKVIEDTFNVKIKLFVYML